MSKGGFTGKGFFGSLPYLVVEYDDGKQKQCNFKHEEDVDRLLCLCGDAFSWDSIAQCGGRAKTGGKRKASGGEIQRSDSV